MVSKNNFYLITLILFICSIIGTGYCDIEEIEYEAEETGDTSTIWVYKGVVPFTHIKTGERVLVKAGEMAVATSESIKVSKIPTDSAGNAQPVTTPVQSEKSRQFCEEICYTKDGALNSFISKLFNSGSECMQECMDSERCVCGDGFKVPCPESCPFIGYESWENFCAPGCCIGKYGGPTVDRNDASCNDPSEKGVRCCEWTKEWNSKYYPRKY